MWCTFICGSHEPILACKVVKVLVALETCFGRDIFSAGIAEQFPCAYKFEDWLEEEGAPLFAEFNQAEVKLWLHLFLLLHCVKLFHHLLQTHASEVCGRFEGWKKKSASPQHFLKIY